MDKDLVLRVFSGNNLFQPVGREQIISLKTRRNRSLSNINTIHTLDDIGA